MDYSPPSSSVHGILQAKILEWVAIPFSRGSSQPRDQTQSSALQADYCLSHKGSPNNVCPKSLSHVGLSATLWTVALQDPLFMDFSKQEYWSGFLCPPSGVLLNPGIEPTSLKSPELGGGFFTTTTTWETCFPQ